MTRPGWDETWMAVARDVALRCDCGKRQVGAVVVGADNRDNWVGYNGPPAGFQAPPGSPCGVGCASYCPQGAEPPDREWALLEPRCVSVHAEVNALMQSDRRLRAGGTVYVTAAPCWKCALAVANSGAARLVCPPWEDDRYHSVARPVYRLFRSTSVKIAHTEETR